MVEPPSILISLFLRTDEQLIDQAVCKILYVQSARIATSMSPRPYRLGRREAANEETRGRVLAAARRLLADPAGLSDFSMEGVARRADVARMTIYYQFGSRRGLLEAPFDDLPPRGKIGQ